MNSTYILGIESSCDDTSAAVLKDRTLLSNVIASQKIHEAYGGVVPELASRAHEQNIVPVVDQALKQAGINKKDLSAIAFTLGPGLMGSLLVGTSFAKGLALSLRLPLIQVNHLHGHILAHFIRVGGKEKTEPRFPFICLLVSGGNSQLVLVHSVKEMEIIGQTIDDAAGEAFDKCGKMLGLDYPAGPQIDRLAAIGDPVSFRFSKPQIPGFDYSFSGLKTSFLYRLRDEMATNGDFIRERKADLSASLQATIVDILMDKLIKASKEYKIKEIALSGGVSANSGLRKAVEETALKKGWTIHLPALSFTTDNAAMIAVAGYYKYLEQDFCGLDAAPYSRVSI
ncbi:MAG: tRNA (adenosine(37)-N6)-threonylcarbamoyltransferase complex transferase subunit TsaD [Bacteroidales bacterium]